MSDKPNNTTAKQTACGSELNNSMLKEQIIKNSAAIVASFLSKFQACAIAEACKGEEGEFFGLMIIKLAQRLLQMPKIFEQDGLGDQAVAYLHYFTGSMDWYITERDLDAQRQAFGLCDLGMDTPELGYINISEITAIGAELDLHWTPKTLEEIKKGRG